MASSDCPYAGMPINEPSPEQVSGRGDKVNITEIGQPSETPVKPGSPASTEQVHHPLGLAHNTLHVPEPGQPNSCSIGHESLVMTAAAVLAIQLQLLTSDSMATTTSIRALLSFGMIIELLAILLAICLPRRYQHGYPSQPLPTLVRLISAVPVVLLLIGIIGLAAALVVETLKTSLVTAVAMGGVLTLGVILCAFTSRFEACGRL